MYRLDGIKISMRLLTKQIMKVQSEHKVTKTSLPNYLDAVMKN